MSFLKCRSVANGVCVGDFLLHRDGAIADVDTRDPEVRPRDASARRARRLRRPRRVRARRDRRVGPEMASLQRRNRVLRQRRAAAPACRRVLDRSGRSSGLPWTMVHERCRRFMQLARQWNGWHIACKQGRFADASSRSRTDLVRGRDWRSYRHGQSHALHQQQELFVVVVARLAAREIRRPRLQGSRAIPPDDADARKEILLLSPSILVPCLTHDGIKVWDTLAIARIPERGQAQGGTAAGGPRGARPLPRGVRRDAFGLQRLRSALPMNLKRVVSRAQGLGARHRATSSGSRRSGRSAWRPTAARSCSASARWPTPCTRRS